MKICLFDIDGTLIRSGGAGKQAFLRTLEQAFDVVVGDPGVPFAGRTDRGIVHDLFAHYDIPVTDQSWDRFTKVYFNLLPDCLAECSGGVLPGVKVLLEQLDAAVKIETGLLTGNMVTGAKIKLGHFALADYFHFGGFGDQHVNRDCVAEQALAATRKHFGEQVVPEQIFVIGDTPADIRCGQAIGAQTVAVCTGNYSAEELASKSPDLILENLSFAEPLIERLGN